jgi:ATP-dependent Clp protease adaptor protein ClpS
MMAEMSSSPAKPDIQRDVDVDVEQDEMVWIEPPYRVLIHNDDVTTFEFVISMLQNIFKLRRSMSEQIAMITHVVGIALVVIKPQSEAEKLVNAGIFAARLEGFPLVLSCEPDE